MKENESRTVWSSDKGDLAVMYRDLELGLETRVGASGVKLSGGQMQRAAAARMFIRGT